jgi:hypothetical protein
MLFRVGHYRPLPGEGFLSQICDGPRVPGEFEIAQLTGPAILDSCFWYQKQAFKAKNQPVF